MLGVGIQQLQVFVVFAVLGLALGAVYLFGMGLFRSRLAIIIFDSIFGSLAIYAVFTTNLYINNGEFRLFTFVALAFGCVLAVFTCKTLLDKASSALYNLFVIREDNDDDALVSQQKNIDTNSSGDSAGAGTALHVADNTVADVVPKSKRSKASGANSRTVRQASRAKRSSSIHANRRIRQTLGGKQRQNVSGRHIVDRQKTRR